MRLSNLWKQTRRLDDLSEEEILALAISAEEDDARIYRAFAKKLRANYPSTAAMFEDMAVQEDTHRAQLIERFQACFGDDIPMIRREHVEGFPKLKPLWLLDNVSIETARDFAKSMEHQAEHFYLKAAKRIQDAPTRKLLADLAAAEAKHGEEADNVKQRHLTDDAKALEEAEQERQFILTWIQPGLAGLMDGSVSTLAPIFATAFATQDTWTTFLVGLAASVGAGISMGFTEAASDDGEISGRGSPVKRGFSSGIMTMVGGLGHALPYLIPDFWIATITAMIVVFVELWAIAWIQKTYMKTPFWRAVMQVVIGGALVLGAGVLIGSG